jgi:hypothetical protein
VDIAAWLRELGLERDEEAFRENEIDAEVLPKLTADDLKDSRRRFPAMRSLMVGLRWRTGDGAESL